MESIMLLNDLSCSKPNKNQHILKEPIGLDCGHCICKSCLPTDASFNIKCSKCGEVNQKDLNNAKSVIHFEKMIEINLKDLYSDLEKQTSGNIARLKSLMADREETIEANVKYIEDEVEIRVESLKIELDKLLDDFKTKLASLKKEIIENSRINLEGLKTKGYEDKLSELRNNLENRYPLDKEKFYNHQDVLISLQKEVKKLESSFNDIRLEFTSSNKILSETFIGDISFLKPMPREMKEIFEKKQFETKALNGRYYDGFLLENSQFLYSTDNKLELYDDQFNLVKTITEFDNKSICPNGIAFDNEKSRIFISDYANHRIIMTDSKLNFIKSFGLQGYDSRTFNYPFGLSLKGTFLYVCDSLNKRIQILDADLQYVVDSIKLDDQPLTIKIIHETLGICGDKGTYFYDLDTKTVLAQYPLILGRMNIIGSYFYVISHSPKKSIYVFDADGSLVDEINIDRFSNSFSCFWDGIITTLNKDYLYVASFNQRQILKFKIKE